MEIKISREAYTIVLTREMKRRYADRYNGGRVTKRKKERQTQRQRQIDRQR